MTNSTRRALLAALATLVAACSGGDKIVSPDELSNNNNTSKKLSSDDSLFVVNQISGAAFASVKALRNIVTPPLPGLGTSVPPAPCNPTITGNTTDTNGNGVPDDKLTTYTAANCTYNNSGTNVVVTGSVRIQDIGGTYGYRVTYSNFNTIGTKGDSTYKTLVNGPIEYQFASTTQGRTQDNLDITISAGSSAGSAAFQRIASLAGTFTPSNGNTLSRTAPLPTGTLTLSGTLNVVVTATGNQIPAGGPSSQTVTMLISTATPMNANIGCSLDQSLNSGELQATVGGSQTGAATVKFTACGQGGTGPTTPSGGGGKK